MLYYTALHYPEKVPLFCQPSTSVQCIKTLEHSIVDADWDEDEDEYGDVTDDQEGLRGHKVGEESAGDGVDLMAGTHENKGQGQGQGQGRLLCQVSTPDSLATYSLETWRQHTVWRQSKDKLP